MARVLAPVDPGSWKPANLDVAVQLARQLAAEVDVVAVPGPLDPAEARAALERLAAGVRDAGIPATGTLIDAESAAAAILRATDAPDVVLVCLTTRSRHGAGHAVWGSVAETVFARAATPVAVVGRATVPPTGPYEHVVACVDGTATGVQALRIAGSLSRAIAADLEVVTVLEPHAPVGPGCSADDILGTIASLAARPISGAHVLSGDHPATVVAGHVRARPTGQLVVTGSRGRTGLQAVLGGSFATGLIAEAPAPVVVVPATIDQEAWLGRLAVSRS